MFKYNNNHIFTGYLKQLLSSVNLPACRIYTHEFAKYFEQHGTEDPRVLESFDSTVQIGATRINYLRNNELYSYFWSSSSKKSWKRSSEVFYNKDKAIHGLTRSLNSANKNYDAATHEYLGEYLRFLRDYYNIDLMSMYNCFNDKISNNIYFSFELSDTSNTQITFNAQDPEYRIYAIPVKLFSEYTIAIDCSQGIELFCGLYNTMLEVSNKTIDLARKTYKKVSQAIFNRPFIYDKLSVNNWPLEADMATTSTDGQFSPAQIRTNLFTRWDIAKREKDLRLFIKVPASCRSSITILEGNYSSFNDTKYSQLINSKYESTATTIWNYSDELNTFKTTLNGEDYVLGIDRSCGNFNGICPIKASDNSSYIQFISKGVTPSIQADSYLISNAVRPTSGNKYNPVLFHSYAGNVYYLDGKLASTCYTGNNMNSTRYLSCSENVNDSISIEIENAGKGYYLTYMIDGKKRYINVVTSLDYQNNRSILNFNTAKTADKIDLNNYTFRPISKLQLLAFNTGESYPFADRLVEYLVGSAITSMEEVPDNIKRTQKVIEQNGYYFEIDGLWENKIQNILYDFMTESGPVVVSDGKLVDKRLGVHPRLGHANKSTLYDILGYVDRETEKWYSSWKNEGGKANVKDNIQNVDIYTDSSGKSIWDV